VIADPTIATGGFITPALVLTGAGVAVVTDLRRRRIYNALTVPAMAIGLVVNTVVDGPRGLHWAATGLLLGAALFLIPVAMGGMGAGDLKLLAALGAIGGPVFVFWCAICASIAGGVMAVAVLVAKRRFGTVVAPMALAVYTHQLPSATSNIRLPYAIPIAFGAVAALILA
jgi:prepilin peptidase CpaA